jgi:hypothetical protein
MGREFQFLMAALEQPNIYVRQWRLIDKQFAKASE